MKKWLLGSLALVILAFWFMHQLLSLSQVDCGLCIGFQGKRECVHALGPSEKQALQEARQNACAVLASGVTDVLACNRADLEAIECHPALLNKKNTKAK